MSYDIKWTQKQGEFQITFSIVIIDIPSSTEKSLIANIVKFSKRVYVELIWLNNNKKQNGQEMEFEIITDTVVFFQPFYFYRNKRILVWFQF